MTQRYIVFLNDRVVTICQDMKCTSVSTNMIVDFTDEFSLINAFKRFFENSECMNLILKTGENFDEACLAFNNMFKRIEAAGGIVRNPNREFLFIKRMGIWDLPKGKLHKAEPIKDGALREVIEETGLASLTITKQLPSTFYIYTDRKGNEILKETFWFEMMCAEDQNLVPQLEEDITEVKWFSSADIEIPVQNTYASLRHLLKSYFQL